MAFPLLDRPFGSHCRRLAVWGASGAGKSSCCAAWGLERLRSGRDALNLPPLFDAEGRASTAVGGRRIGLVCRQHYALTSHHLTCANVSFSLFFFFLGVPARASGAGGVGLARGRSGLSPLRKRYPASFRQASSKRVALARALAIVNPELFCLDEPFAARMPILAGPSCS